MGKKGFGSNLVPVKPLQTAAGNEHLCLATTLCKQIYIYTVYLMILDNQDQGISKCKPSELETLVSTQFYQ